MISNWADQKTKKSSGKKLLVLHRIGQVMVRCGVTLASREAWSLYAAPSLTLGGPEGGQYGGH